MVSSDVKETITKENNGNIKSEYEPTRNWKSKAYRESEKKF